METPAPPAAAARRDPLRHLRHHEALASPFGSDAFGRKAEAFARFFGTSAFLVGQTALVAAWIVVNAAAVALRWDPYPFILLNLAFSTQAAYAAPLILLAQTRQADRDKHQAVADAKHRDEIGEAHGAQLEAIRVLLEQNTTLTEQVERLTARIEAHVGSPGTAGGPA